MSAPVYLGIDTATPYLSLALWSPQHGTLAQICERVEREHTRHILGELEQLFKTGGAVKSDLKGITVGLGPGSYTGLRVGHATAQGLARGLGITYKGTSSLEAVAATVLSEGKTGIVAFDARRGNVYAGVYEQRDHSVFVHKSAAKLARDRLRSAHPDLPYFEGNAPDASYLARCFLECEETNKSLIYL